MKKMSVTEMKSVSAGGVGKCNICGQVCWTTFTVGWHRIVTGHKSFTTWYK